jgi:hypothetical protein
VATRYCLGICLAGAIRNGSYKDFVGAATHDDGRPCTADEIFDAFMEHIRQGHEIIPFGKGCDRWDWKDGCQGHPVPEPAEVIDEGRQ